MPRMLERSAAGMACFCLAGMAVAGCGARSAYPKSWPPVPASASDICEGFAGTYRDVGEGVGYDGRSSPYSLTGILLGEGHPMRVTGRGVAGSQSTGAPDRVTLSFPQAGQVDVVASGPQSQFRVYPAATMACACREGRAIIEKRPRWVQAGEILSVARLSETVELQSIDGWLVVKWQEQTLMLLAMVVPVPSRDSDWFRFERYVPEP